MFVGYTVPYWQLGNQFLFTKKVWINVIAGCKETLAPGKGSQISHLISLSYCQCLISRSLFAISCAYRS